MKRWKLLLISLTLTALLAGCAGQTLPSLPGAENETEETGGSRIPEVSPEDLPQQPSAPEPPAEPEPPEAPAEDPELTARRTALLEEANALAASYRYDDALALLRDAPELANDETAAKTAELEAQQAALVPYEGTVYHVFFHSLIVDTSKAFDGGVSSEGYDLWMTTRDEFRAMLPQLEERGYVLVDYADLADVGEDGTVTPKQLLLPPGKKPLLLSVDDVCYYDYMKGDGFAERLALDENGDVATVVDGVLTRDGDVVPILDDYVREHPGFSYRGAKGILAVTGYEGVFGYRITDLEGEELARAQAEAKAVSDRLKETGWRIACHSYTHNSYFQDGSVTMEQLQSDTERWQTRIAPVTGTTNLYISAFGMPLTAGDPRLSYLNDQGFTVYCPVEMDMGLSWTGKTLIHARFNLDGYSMRNRQSRIEELFFDVQSVYDPARPVPLPQ